MENTTPSRRRLLLTAGSFATAMVMARPALRGAEAQGLIREQAIVPDLAQSMPENIAGPFAVAPLPYPVSALVPSISAETMMFHHGRHHAAYVNKLNEIARNYPQIGHAPPQELLANLRELPDSIRTDIRNNLGGHVNHTMFWTIMKHDGGGAPTGDVATAIDRDLGGLERMQAAVDAAGNKTFGSGWVFVTVTPEGKLAIETRPNQDSPLMDGKRVLFGNDVWEHAYYLDYRNRRDTYLQEWWNVVNWEEIGNRYSAAKVGTLTI